MKVKLPDFDHLMNLARNKPEDLEKLRDQLIENTIQSAPKNSQRRLRGIQFQVDMQIRKSNNPMAACIAVSELMYKSLQELQLSLNDPDSINDRIKTPTPTCTPADVICMSEKRNLKQLKV
ncbi:DUF3135 domain-containing protein [Zooshikella marina]|uniref:DUF3135 domain-containing protein n=1 Tax=Zooshikella ganghwensis TaxID=202772 RepID=A0A4P9VQQ2_9GAMM|nr:DUF3135 domain-containing protein [Zooshikella ganghwensis]MBU2705693.1 DUF3135 domain-containing protein [Zooshikella ganghwensis]RDH45109.1 DUF3135 domain-containing protein [Zooshikella ganghwensis]